MVDDGKMSNAIRSTATLGMLITGLLFGWQVSAAIIIAGGYGLYVWAFAGANAWNIIGQVVLVGMAVVTFVLAIKIVYDKTSGKKNY